MTRTATKTKTGAQARPVATVDYLLRGVDAQTWAQVQTRAEQASLPVRQVLLQLVDAYARGAIAVEQTYVVKHADGAYALDESQRLQTRTLTKRGGAK